MFRLIANLFSARVQTRSITDELLITEQQQSAHLLGSVQIDAGTLLAQFSPKIFHDKKRLLFDMALARGLHGPLAIRRYGEIPLPHKYEPFTPSTEIIGRKGYFRYATSPETDDWFMNFAHHDLFHGYGHFMFAQDEVQVAEHPALACVREMMQARTDSLRPATVENGSPTPILIRGVQLMLKIDTRAIYGARFSHATDDTIRQSVTEIDPPTHSNILAIEAPIHSGNRIYTRAEIEAALRTAYAGFRAVVLASVADCSPAKPIVLNTGNWGCGAYGGNRQLMLTVQILAARLAGIARVVFYCGTDSVEDVTTFDSALSHRFKFYPGAKLEHVIDRLVAAAFPWGMPDGN